MPYQTTFVLDAIRQLALLRAGPQDDGYRFALAWLVGARMVQEGILPEGARLTALADQTAWSAAHPITGPLCAEIIWGKSGSGLGNEMELPQAAARVLLVCA
jgi:hypothetical protein